MKLIVTNKAILKDVTPYWIKILTDMFTLKNPAYLEAVIRKRSKYGIKKNLYFYKRQGKDFLFPRGSAGSLYKLISKEEPLEVFDCSFSLPPFDFVFKSDLRPYQKKAENRILKKQFGVLESGTGSGKTVMALSIIAKRQQPTLIIVHTKELLYQWKERIFTFLGEECGLIGDGLFDIKPITVAIANTAGKHLPLLTTKFGHLVVDECHRVPATLFSNIVNSFPCKYMLGLSATPYRRDGLDIIIGWFMGTHRVIIEPEVLRKCGAVLTPNFIVQKTGFVNKGKDQDYQTIVSSLIKNEDRNDLIVKDIIKISNDGNLSLVVSDRIEHLKILQEKLNIKSLLLTGSTKPEDRKKIVKSLSESGTLVLFSTLALIGEGFDCPDMTNLFLTFPVAYVGRLTQVIGRILRPGKDKQPNVFDYWDVHVNVLYTQGLERQKIYSTM